MKKKYQGREFTVSIQAPDKAQLEKMIRGIRAYAKRHEMESFKVLQRGRDPDGGYKAIITAHNWNPFKWAKERWEVRGGGEKARAITKRAEERVVYAIVKPYIDERTDTINIVAALRAGVSPSVLHKAGVKKRDVSDIQGKIRAEAGAESDRRKVERESKQIEVKILRTRAKTRKLLSEAEYKRAQLSIVRAREALGERSLFEHVARGVIKLKKVKHKRAKLHLRTYGRGEVGLKGVRV